jgi:hypothetical protein
MIGSLKYFLVPHRPGMKPARALVFQSLMLYEPETIAAAWRKDG